MTRIVAASIDHVPSARRSPAAITPPHFSTAPITRNVLRVGRITRNTLREYSHPHGDDKYAIADYDTDRSLTLAVASGGYAGEKGSLRPLDHCIWERMSLLC